MPTKRRIDPTHGISESLIDIPDITAAALDKAALEAEKKRIEERYKADMQRLSRWKKDKTRVEQYNKLHETVSDMVPVEVFVTYPKAKKADLISLNSLGLTGNQEINFMMYSIVKRLDTGEVYVIPDYLSDFIENNRHKEWVERTDKSPRLKEFLPEPPRKLYAMEALFSDNRFQLDPLNIDSSPEAYYTYFIPKSTMLTKYKG